MESKIVHSVGKLGQDQLNDVVLAAVVTREGEEALQVSVLRNTDDGDERLIQSRWAYLNLKLPSDGKNFQFRSLWIGDRDASTSGNELSISLAYDIEDSEKPVGLVYLVCSLDEGTQALVNPQGRYVETCPLGQERSVDIKQLSREEIQHPQPLKTGSVDATALYLRTLTLEDFRRIGDSPAFAMDVLRKMQTVSSAERDRFLNQLSGAICEVEGGKILGQLALQVARRREEAAQSQGAFTGLDTLVADLMTKNLSSAALPLTSDDDLIVDFFSVRSDGISAQQRADSTPEDGCEAILMGLLGDNILIDLRDRLEGGWISWTTDREEELICMIDKSLAQRKENDAQLSKAQTPLTNGVDRKKIASSPE